jgi:hypothetical protein
MHQPISYLDMSVPAFIYHCVFIILSGLLDSMPGLCQVVWFILLKMFSHYN